MSKFVGYGYKLFKTLKSPITQLGRLKQKQKTTGTEVIKSVKPAVHKSKGAQKLAETYIDIGKQRGKMKRSFQKMEEDIDPARTKLRKTTQKIAGRKVTESGFNKGKDLKK